MKLHKLKFLSKISIVYDDRLYLNRIETELCRQILWRFRCAHGLSDNIVKRAELQRYSKNGNFQPEMYCVIMANTWQFFNLDQFSRLIDKKEIVIFEHPPCLPDLTLIDFILFSKFRSIYKDMKWIQKNMKGNTFTSTNE